MSTETLAELRRRAAAEQGSILLETSLPSPEPARTLFFSEPVAWLEARALKDVKPLLERLEQALGEGLWVAGYMGYECGAALEPKAAARVDGSAADGLPLAAFGLYGSPLQLPAGISAGDARTANAGSLRLRIGEDVFAEKVARIRAWIAAGDTYQVNLTDRLEGEFAGEPEALFAAMMEAQPVSYGALLRVGNSVILSASPELFFRLRGRQITVRPMKGTAPRGRDREEDEACAAALQADAKNRAENLMIVDLMRSDVGRIAEMGSVRVEQLFAVERFPSLLQMTSTVTARLRPGTGLGGVFASLFPSGSVTGAPRIRTMQIIAGLEGRARGVYTGAIGYASPEGEAEFSVAIRTAVLRGSTLIMGVGCGITYDSEPQAEYAECLLKGRFLTEPPLRLIETMRCEDGACALLELHLDRLAASTEYLGFACDRGRVASEVHNACAARPAGAWKLRFELDRHGQLHWSLPETIEPTSRPLRVMPASEPVDPEQRLLRHKTTRREVYARAMAEAAAAGCEEALLSNTRGELTEGTRHSLLVRHGSQWRTPPVSAGLLPGVSRGHLLRTMPGLREATLLPADLATADEIWLTNAVHGPRTAQWVRSNRLE